MKIQRQINVLENGSVFARAANAAHLPRPQFGVGEEVRVMTRGQECRGFIERVAATKEGRYKEGRYYEWLYIVTTRKERYTLERREAQLLVLNPRALPGDVYDWLSGSISAPTYDDSRQLSMRAWLEKHAGSPDDLLHWLTEEPPRQPGDTEPYAPEQTNAWAAAVDNLDMSALGCDECYRCEQLGWWRCERCGREFP